MCTCSYIPRPNKSFILTSNRDESPSRAAMQISNLETAERMVYFPKDEEAGGTWMAMDTDGRAVCLLNGADKKHVRTEPYRRSRGLMVLDYFSFKDHVKFIADYNFEGIEPFTMILVKQFDLTVLKWNGKEKKVAVLDPHKQYIWSSAMLYDETSIAKRKSWFETWKLEQNFSHESIVKFHKSKGKDSQEEGLLIDRKDGPKTLSITSVQKNEYSSTLEHYDLVENKIRRVFVEHRAAKNHPLT